MANPGPASATTNHPSNLGTNQAIRLIASAQGVNLNSVGDTAAPILVSGRVSPLYVLVSNASVNLTTAQLAVYTGAGATGSTVLGATALTGATTAAKVVSASATTDALTGGTLYIRNTTAQGAAATADVFVYGYDLTFLP